MIIFKLGCHNRFVKYCCVNMPMLEHIREAESDHDGTDVMIAFFPNGQLLTTYSAVCHRPPSQTTILTTMVSQNHMTLMLPHKYKCTPSSMYMLSERHTLLHRAKQNRFRQETITMFLCQRQLVVVSAVYRTHLIWIFPTALLQRLEARLRLSNVSCSI